MNDPNKSLLEQAKKAALEDVRKEKPSAFTVGGYVDDKGRVIAAVTYDRKLSNLWGLTAYAKAYWNDVSVTAHPATEAGVELTRKF